MLLFVLAAAAPDPLIERLRVLPEGGESTCPFEITMAFEGGGEEGRQRLRVDPMTEDVTLLDENGEPMETESGNEDGGDEGDSVDLGGAGYEQALTALDWPLTRKDGPDGQVVFVASELPDQTVMFGDKDLSKQAIATLTVRDDPETPFIEGYRTELTKPVRMKMVARVTDYSRDVRFAMVRGAPRPVSDRMAATFSMLGSEEAVTFDLSYDYPSCSE